MKNKICKLIVSFILVFSILSIFYLNNVENIEEVDATTYYISYDGTTLDTSSLPAKFTSGDSVVISSSVNVNYSKYYSDDTFIATDSISGGSSTTIEGLIPGVTFSLGYDTATYIKVTIPCMTVKFDGNGATKGNCPTSLTGKKYGDAITLPGNTGNLKYGIRQFLGWSLNKNGISDDVITTYSVSTVDLNSDWEIVFYAIWSAGGVSLTQEQTITTYNGSPQTYVITGTDCNIGNFVIKYASSDLEPRNDSDWSTTAPTTAGDYDVWITRASDDHYLEYSDVHAYGLVIFRQAVSEPTVSGTYTYNGSTQNVVLNGAESYMTASVDSKLSGKDAGNYTITYTLDRNHKWANGSDGTLSWSISKKLVELEWTNTELIYTGDNLKPTCNVKSSSLCGSDSVSVTVTGEQTSVGSYTATASALSSDNYMLPNYVTQSFSIIKPYTITYNLDGGTNNSSNPARYDSTDETFSLLNPTKNGYKFEGWYDNSTFSGNKIEVINTGSTGNKVFYAKWKSLKYDKNINLNVSDLKYGMKLSDITYFSSTDSLSILDSVLYKVNNNTYTKLGPNDEVKTTGVYILGFIIRGGSNDTWFSILSDNITFPTYNKYTLVDTLDINSYEFSDTKITVERSGQFYENNYVYVKLKYIVYDYKLTYNGNGGSYVSNMPSADNNFYVDGYPYPITTTIPTRTGHNFLGWSLSATGSVITDSTVNIYQGITLYAQWSVIPITVNNIVFNKILTSEDLNSSISISSGNYYLIENTTIGSSDGVVKVSYGTNVNICLNGFGLDFNESWGFGVYGNLAFYDDSTVVHKWKDYDSATNHLYRINDEGTILSTGGYITKSNNAATNAGYFYVDEYATLTFNNVDIIGMNNNTNYYPIIQTSYTDVDLNSGSKIKFENGCNILGNFVGRNSFALLKYNSELSISDCTIENNTAQHIFYIQDGGENFIGDNVIIRNNNYSGTTFGDKYRAGLALSRLTNHDPVLKIKEDITGTSIDFNVCCTQLFGNDSLGFKISTDSNKDYSSIFNIYASSSDQIMIDPSNNFKVRSVKNGNVYNLYLSKYTTVKYDEYTSSYNGYVTTTDGSDFPTDTNIYFVGDEIAVSSKELVLKTQGKLVDRIFMGWNTEYAFNLSYSFKDKAIYSPGSKYTVTSIAVGTGNPVINFHTVFKAKTLCYNQTLGKFVYAYPESTEVCTDVLDMYSVSGDNNDIVTLNNFNYTICGAYAIQFNGDTPLTLILKGTNNINASDLTNYGIEIYQPITIKGDGTLNLSGLLKILKNVILESGTINITGSNDPDDENVTLSLPTYFSMTGGKITVSSSIDGRHALAFGCSNIIVKVKKLQSDEALTYLKDAFYDFETCMYYSQVGEDDEAIVYDYCEITTYDNFISPSANNNFEAQGMDESTYQWYSSKESLIDAKLIDLAAYFDGFGLTGSETTTDGLTISSEIGSILLVVPDEVKGEYLTFTSDRLLVSDLSHGICSQYEYNKLTLVKQEEGVYYYKSEYLVYVGFNIIVMDIPSTSTDYNITIKNVKYAYPTTKIENATGKTYTPTESGEYVVKATLSYATATSDELYATTISFDANSGVGSVDSICNFVGKTITLPTSGVTKENYYLLGWNTDKNATTALSSSYVLTDEDVTLYAIWVDKEVVSLTLDAQNKTYNGSAQGFDLVGASKDIGSYTISYFVNNNWTTTAPTNSGSYNVKITRNEDNIYYAYSQEITNGLVIKKVKVTLPTAVTGFVYDGFSKTGVVLPNNAVYTLQDNVKTNAGSYTAKAVLNDKTNYEWDLSNVSSNDQDISWSISKADQTLDVSNVITSYTYNGHKQVINSGATSTYSDAVIVYSNNELSNAGTYTVDIKAQESTNYNEATASVTVTITEAVVKVDNKVLTEDIKPEEGSKVEIKQGAIETGVVVVIAKDNVKASNVEKKNIKQAVSNKSELVARFDIHLEDNNGVKVENIDGNLYRVSLVVPEKLQKRSNLKIVYIDDNGNVELISSTLDSNILVFETSHFSTWAIVADEASGFIVVLVVILVLIGLFVGFYFVWKKEIDDKDMVDENRKFKFADVVYKPINNLLNKLFLKK